MGIMLPLECLTAGVSVEPGADCDVLLRTDGMGRLTRNTKEANRRVQAIFFDQLDQTAIVTVLQREGEEARRSRGVVSQLIMLVHSSWVCLCLCVRLDLKYPFQMFLIDDDLRPRFV